MATITRGDSPNLRNVRGNVYHHYIRVDNPKLLIFLSGQLSRDADGRMVGKGDLTEQTRQAIRNKRTVPEATGGTLDDIVSVVVYTTDVREFRQIVEARTEFFTKNLPTSTIVEVNHLSEPGLHAFQFQERHGCLSSSAKGSTGGAQGHHRHHSQAGPSGRCHDQARDRLCRCRSGILRKTLSITDHTKYDTKSPGTGIELVAIQGATIPA